MVRFGVLGSKSKCTTKSISSSKADLLKKNLRKKKGGLKKNTCSFVFVAGFPEIHKYQSKSIQHHPSIPGPFFDFPPFGLRLSAHASAEINTLFARTTLWVFE